MATLIEVSDLTALPSQITFQEGDVLMLNATGGHVTLNTNVVELLGPFIAGVLSNSWQIITPMGAPGTILFVARQPGKATIDVVTGDAFYNPVTTSIEIMVV